MVREFEDIKTWQQARALTKGVYAATYRTAFRSHASLSDQMQRAAVSIMANIAEGFERGGRKEFIQFLYIAKGSSGELRSHLTVAWDQGLLPKKEFEDLAAQARTTSKLLYRFIESLKSTPIKGQKYKTPAD
jgi:four helix bundle protein